MAIGIVKDRIEGTRISVFNVYYYQVNGAPRDEIKEALGISTEELEAAERFIEGNQEYVKGVHEQIEERNRRGNSPEIEARLVETRARMQAWLAARRRDLHQETNGEGYPV